MPQEDGKEDGTVRKMKSGKGRRNGNEDDQQTPDLRFLHLPFPPSAPG
jgi:hypothetical protein